MFFRGHFDDASSGLVRDLMGDVRPPALAWIVHQQEVHHRIGALRSLDGLLDPHLAPKILRVRNDYQRLAACFRGQFFPTDQPNRIIHMGSIGPGRQGARRHHRSARVDLRVMDGALKLGAIVGEVGEHVHVQVEGDHHRLVALAKNLVQETRRSLLFCTQAILLAAAGVNQQPQRDRKRLFRRKKGDLLLLIVFKNPEVLLLERGDNLLFLVPHRGENVDQADFAFDRGRLLVTLLRWLLPPHRRRHRPCNQCSCAARHNFVHRTHVYFPGHKMPAKRAARVIAAQ